MSEQNPLFLVPILWWPGRGNNTLHAVGSGNVGVSQDGVRKNMHSSILQTWLRQSQNLFIKSQTLFF